MQATQTKPANLVGRQESLNEVHHEKWAHHHVNWTAVGVGAMTAFSLLLLFGLVGVAVGAHHFGPEHRLVDLRKLGIGSLVFSVVSAFFSFVAGGWVAGKIAGILHSEPGMLHGAIAWLVTVPMLVLAAGLGSSSLFGSWYSGLGNNQASANSPFIRPDRPDFNASPAEVATYRELQAEYTRHVREWNEETPKVTRNTAIGLATALLLGLIGCSIGGWWASGEPMNFTHYLTRKPMYHHSA